MWLSWPQSNTGGRGEQGDGGGEKGETNLKHVLLQCCIISI